MNMTVNIATKMSHGQSMCRRFHIPVQMMLITAIVLGFGVPTAQATHYRYGHVQWTPGNGENEINFVIQNAWRLNQGQCIDPETGETTPCTGPDGLPGPGDIHRQGVSSPVFHFGDGNTLSFPSGILHFVTSFDSENNWYRGTVVDHTQFPDIVTTISHTYDEPGDYLAHFPDCCRISATSFPNRHINNPDQPTRIETIVNVGTGNSSPLSTLLTIQPCPIDDVCTINIQDHAHDPDGDTLRFRLSTPSEAGDSSFVQPGEGQSNVDNAFIDEETGVYTWNTTGADDGDVDLDEWNVLYSTQVTIEDLDENGNVKSKVAVDFFIQLVPADCPPQIEGVDETNIETVPGDETSFSMTASAAGVAQNLIWPATDENGDPATGCSNCYDDTISPFHAGIDFVPVPHDDENHEIRAAANGIVWKVGDECDPCFLPCNSGCACCDCNCGSGFGNYVIIYHPAHDFFSLYAHLSEVDVEEEQCVNQDQPLGIMGATGASFTNLHHHGTGIHLHFELKHFGSLPNVPDGPHWGSSTVHPNLAGYQNPFPYLEFDLTFFDSPIAVASNGDQSVLTSPEPSQYTVQEVTSVSAGQKFAAFAEYEGWYQIYFPSKDGPATGWIQATPDPSAQVALIVDPNIDDQLDSFIGVNVWEQPNTDQNTDVLSRVWVRQWVVVQDEEGPNPGGCAGCWFRIHLADNDGGGTGWVCSDDVNLPCTGEQQQSAGGGAAAAAQSDDQVTMNVVGLPPGATMDPPLPLTGQTVTSEFSWMPMEAQVGTYIVVFTATSQTGQSSTFPVTITVHEQIDVPVHFDIRPGGCPNPLNRVSQGVLPAAILGSDDLDVSIIDPDSIVLSRADGVGGQVTPLNGPPGPGMTIEDVSAPFDGEDACDCAELGPDGIDDLMLKFNTPDLVAELGLENILPGQNVELVIEGELTDGTPFTGTDCIDIVGAGVQDLLIVLNNWGSCADCDDCMADITGDCNVGVEDLLIILNNWE